MLKAMYFNDIRTVWCKPVACTQSWFVVACLHISYE
jgi:hypothetical protein